MLDLFEEQVQPDWKEEIKYLSQASGLNLSWLKTKDFKAVLTIDDLVEMVEDIKDKPMYFVDTETTGVLFTDKVVSVQICAEKDKAYFIPVRMQSCANIDPKDFVKYLKPLLENEEKTIVCFNAKFDGKMLRNIIVQGVGIDIFKSKIIDLQICFKLKDPDQKLTLKSLTKKVLGLDQLELEHLFKKVGSAKRVIAFPSLQLSHAIPYACSDVEVMFNIYEKSKDNLNLEDKIVQLEHKVQRIVADMECRGLYVNKNLLAKAEKECLAEMNRLNELILKAAGQSFRINSNVDMANYLYGTLGLKVLLTTDKGAPAVSKEALEPYKETVPFVDWVLKYKEAAKLLKSFIQKIPEYCDSTSSVHPNFNHLGAASGRFTCTDPNFQQLPKQRGSELDFRSAIRRAVQPRPGYIIFDMDYSQIEYRVFASLAGDENLKQAYHDGLDFHQATAAMVYGVPYDQVTKLQRINAKCVAGDTYLFSPEGLIKFRDLSARRDVGKFDNSVKRLVQNDSSEVSQALSVYYAGYAPAIKATLDFGYSLTGSKEKHRVKVINKDGFVEFKKMADLTNSDYVLFSRKRIKSEVTEYVKYNTEFWKPSEKPEGLSDQDSLIYDTVVEFRGNRDEAALKLNLPRSTVQQAANRMGIPVSIKGKPHKYLPKVLTEDIARLWGMLLSDGYFAEGETSSFCSYTTADQENFSWFFEKAKQNFGDCVTFSYTVPLNKKPFWTVKINSTWVSDFFKGGKEMKSISAHIPQDIFNSPVSVQQAFLIGWFNGDGHIKENSIDSGSISKQMTKDLRSLLLYHGILTNEETERNKRLPYKGGALYSKPYYKFKIVTLESRKRFYNFIGQYLISSKVTRLNAYFDRMKNEETRGIYIVNQKENVKKIFGLLSTFTKDSKNVRRVKNGGLKTLSVNQIYYILKDLQNKDLTEEQIKIRDFYRYILDNDLMALRVKGVEEVFTELFDIFVPKDNTFISGGFISENTINFGLLYGLSSYSLSQRLGISEAEAEEMKESYFENKPRVREWTEEVHELAKKHGYIKTYFGRRRLLRELYSKDKSVYAAGLRKSVNSSVQGAAADILKIAFVRIDKAIKENNLDVYLIATIHDEIVFEVGLNQDLRKVFKILQDAMEVQVEGWVPIVAEPEAAFNFSDLVEVGEDFPFDNIDSLRNKEAEDIKQEDLQEQAPENVTLILPEGMSKIAFNNFKQKLKDNPGDEQVLVALGSAKPTMIKSTITVSNSLVDSLEDLNIKVILPDRIVNTLI